MMDEYGKLKALAVAFHSLAAIPWVAEADAGPGNAGIVKALEDVWTGREGHGMGCRYAARFCLHTRRGFDFDLRGALAAWDDEHRRVWQAWATNPFYL